MKLEQLISVLDARGNIAVYTRFDAKVFDGSVYELFDCKEVYINYFVKEMVIDFDKKVKVLVDKK